MRSLTVAGSTLCLSHAGSDRDRRGFHDRDCMQGASPARLRGLDGPSRIDRGPGLRGSFGGGRRGVLGPVQKNSDHEKCGNGEDEHAEDCLPEPQENQPGDAYCREDGPATYDTDPTEYCSSCDESEKDESRLAVAWLRKVVEEHPNETERGENSQSSHDIRLRLGCAHTVQTRYSELTIGLLYPPADSRTAVLTALREFVQLVVHTSRVSRKPVFSEPADTKGPQIER